MRLRIRRSARVGTDASARVHRAGRRGIAGASVRDARAVEVPSALDNAAERVPRPYVRELARRGAVVDEARRTRMMRATLERPNREVADKAARARVREPRRSPRERRGGRHRHPRRRDPYTGRGLEPIPARQQTSRLLPQKVRGKAPCREKESPAAGSLSKSRAAGLPRTHATSRAALVHVPASVS